MTKVKKTDNTKPVEDKKTDLKPIERGQDGTIEIRLTLKWDEIEKESKIAVEKLAEGITLPGFRKGKAPLKLVEEKIDNAKVRDEVVKKLLPTAYAKVLSENNIRPIIDPQIHIDGELKDGSDWLFHALTCELPEADLGNYKEEIKKITAKTKIVVPGKEQEKPNFDEIVNKLIEIVKITIPGILIQMEADRLLSQMLEEIKKLGMNLDTYLSTTGKSAEDIRAEYAKKAEHDLKLEFIMQKISQTEKITVEDAEIQKTIDNAKPEERASLEANKYLLASIIRQQKTLDFLKNL